MKATIQYTNENGVKVSVYPMAKPRNNERTFRNNKYSIFNRGRQQSMFGRAGQYATVDNLV